MILRTVYCARQDSRGADHNLLFLVKFQPFRVSSLTLQVNSGPEGSRISPLCGTDVGHLHGRIAKALRDHPCRALAVPIMQQVQIGKCLDSGHCAAGTRV